MKLPIRNIYNGLVQHTVEFIQENDVKYEQDADKSPFISQLKSSRNN